MRHADSRAVDAGIGLNFDPILHDDGARLHYLAVRSIRLPDESKTITPNDRAVLQYDIVADAHPLAYHGVGMGEEAVPDLGRTMNDGETLEDAIVA